MATSLLLEDFRLSGDMLQRWMWNHMREHEKIVQKINKTYNTNLLLYNLYPFTKEAESRWYNDHQQAHNDFNSRFNLQSNDLQFPDFKNEDLMRKWLREHWLEHLAINNKLGI